MGTGKFYNSFKRNDGGWETQEWSASEMFDYYFIKYILIGVALSFLSAVVSGILLLVRLFDYDNDEKAPTFIGIGTSLYFVIDYANGWIISWVIKSLNYASELRLMAIWNLTMLLTHVFILVLGDTIYFNAKETERKRTLFIYTGFVVVILYNISKCFF